MSKIGIERAAAVLAKRVAPVYVLLKWHWTVRAGKSVPRYVPTEADIRGTLVGLYDELSSEAFTKGAADSIGTGGLEVYRYRDEERVAHYVFRFKMEEALDWHEHFASAVTPAVLSESGQKVA
jgi:hypothetical protein